MCFVGRIRIQDILTCGFLDDLLEVMNNNYDMTAAAAILLLFILMFVVCVFPMCIVEMSG